MAKNPARAKRLDENMPLRATRMGVGQQESRPTVTGHPDNSARLKALKENIRAVAGTNNSRSKMTRDSQEKVKQTLDQIRTKFGETAFQDAVQQFKLDYQGLSRVNLMRNKGPSINQEDHLQPPP